MLTFRNLFVILKKGCAILNGTRIFIKRRKVKVKFLKKNLLWVFCGGLGLLTLIFLAIPYATIVSGGFGISVKAPVNGYSIMSYWSFQSGRRT